MGKGKNSAVSTRAADLGRRRLLEALAVGGAGAGLSGCAVSAGMDEPGTGTQNNLLWAVAWKQTAAEYRALCYQAYSLARLRIDAAIENRAATDRPLAVITDMDDTIMHANSYWGYLVSQDLDFFDDSIWDTWLPENHVTAVPGARDFLRYCQTRNVAVFYVTNRDQGERTFEYALKQLQHLDMPYADAEHLTVFRETSDKSPAREAIARRYKVALMLGDNLNDFRRDYYVRGVDERMGLMERDREDWGDKFIVLPNPTDGHWVRAIFGESEPAPTEENRRLLKAAASRVTWNAR